MTSPPRPLQARSRLLLLLSAMLALAGGSQVSQMQAPVAIPEAVFDQLNASGEALVIVGIQHAAVPEGDLATQSEVAEQRAALQMALDDAVDRATAMGVSSAKRFDTIPFFSARVDAASVKALAAMPGVTSITLDELTVPTLLQSVPLVGAPAAWAAGSTGANWSVAVLDSGVQANHPFLSGRVVAEACFSDAAGAGFVTTTLCPGGASIAVGPGTAAACESTTSGCFHGTHVAGIAAGANGTGALAGANGVAPGANIIAVQIFSRIPDPANCGSTPAPCIGGYTSDIIRGLEYVLGLAGPGNANRVAAVNMSLGGSTLYTTPAACDAANGPYKWAIDNLRSVGIPSVISAGNQGQNTGMNAPGCISTAISVGSTTKTDAVSTFSNRNSFTHLMAPGGDATAMGGILSSIPGSSAGIASGTSMAAPHVAGAWAILKQAVPGAGVSQVLAALQSSGVAIADGALTHRRISVNAARTALIGLAAGIPGAPGQPVITGAGSAITISSAPPTSGGSPTSYTLLGRLTPGGPIIATLPLGSTPSISVSAPVGSFVVSMQASNAAGPGPESTPTTFSVPFVPAPPGQPQLFGWHSAGNEVRFVWSPPITGGLPTGYIVHAALTSGGPPVASLPVTGTSLAVQNVPNGTYYVTVVATNAGGSGPPTSQATINITGTLLPGAPSLLPAQVSGGQVTLTWYSAATGGFPTSYTVIGSLSSGGPPIATLTTTSTRLTVPAPPTGTYYVRVAASNTAGTGPVSNQVSFSIP